MWKAALNRSIREIRFVLKQAPEHHGVWNFIQTKLPELRVLNQTTKFTVDEISDEFETPSACHILYGDANATEEEILSAGLSNKDFEEILKQKIQIGLSLERKQAWKSLPVDIVEARKHVKYFDDHF